MNKQQKLKKNKNFVPSKKMGQNFLTDKNIAREIINLVNVEQYDLIIEVGPGMGALTQYLVEFNRKVIAIELDKRLAAKLKTQFIQYSNLEIINNDILQVDLVKICKDYQRIVLVSNLPYSISTPMMLKFIKQNKISTFYCMLQKELVDRLIAKPNTKDYGSISVLMQSYTNVAKLLNVPPQSFTPAPKVESNVIVINKNENQYDEQWSQFIRKCFAFKRKTLVNNLKQYFSLSLLQKKLENLDISLTIRSEQLSKEILWQLYKEVRNG